MSTLLVFAAVGVIAFILFMGWVLSRMSALGDREDR